MRYQKYVAVAAKASGDMPLRRATQANINRLMDLYDHITDKAGVEPEPVRMAVAGFRPVKAADALSDNKKFKDATFESQILLEKHFRKHAAQYGEISEDEYVSRARGLLRKAASDDIMVLVRADGSVAKYRISTNEFVVGTKNGFIRTAFKPSNQFEYWRDELERNK